MSESKFDNWLFRAEKLIRLLKPKFHNTITRVVVVFGLTMVAESQVNIIEAFAVAIYESFFGPSDLLRGLFAGRSSPWVGVTFVIFGLIYSALVTVGLELIEKYKSALPLAPDLDLRCLNADMHEMTSPYKLRGELCSHSIAEIPDNSSYSKHAKLRMNPSFPGMIYPIGINDPRVNKDFYRERAKFLCVWGGAEIIQLAIENVGTLLARNVRVELRLNKIPGLSTTNKNDLHPKLPLQETESNLSILTSSTFASHVADCDIKSSHTPSEYFFEWEVGDLQAKECRSSVTSIFLRAESEAELAIRIFCDELSEPIEKNIKILPTNESFELDMNLLKLENEAFVKSVDSKIMDGYLGRRFEQRTKAFESENKNLVP